MKILPVKLLETERLELQPLTMKHCEGYTTHFVDYEVVRHLSTAVPWPYPEDGVREFIEQVVLPGQGKSRWDWAICLKDNNLEVIGSVGLLEPTQSLNRGFWLGRPFWGRGFMSEATHAVNQFAFEELGFEELKLSNALGNTRSRKVKQRRGAEFLGTVESTFVDPSYTHAERWRLTRQHWEAYLKECETCS